MPPPYVIGLTGNIASGKSLVSTMLAERGAAVIDADQVAHEVLAAGTPETAAVARQFGAHLLRPDGSVERPALGRIVFGDAGALADLEAIVHPGTRTRILDRISRSRARVVVVEAIKLLEGPLADHVDTVWVVTAPRDARIQRLNRARDISAAEAEQRVEAQNPEEEKVRRADVVLANDGSVADLRRQVESAWRALEEKLGKDE